MADLSKIKLNGTAYELKDAVAREHMPSSTDSNKWNKTSALFSVSSYRAGEDYYWNLNIPYTGLMNYTNAPGSQGFLGRITIPKNITLTLPSTSGTLALTSQIPAATTITNTLASGTRIATINNTDIYAPESESGGITTETDPIFSASAAAGITTEKINAWDAKSDFSGSYNDLSDKPTITDEKVKQTAVSDGVSSALPILFAQSTSQTEQTNAVYKHDVLWYQPSTGRLHAKKLQLGDKTTAGTIELANISLTGASSDTPVTIILPTTTGTVALTSDIPSVPSWALAANKPTYTASEVGALPDTYTAPVTSVNGQTGAVTLSIPTVSITQNLTSGTKSATISIDGTDYDIYSETNTDEKVKTTEYTPDTNYHALIFGSSTASTESKYISKSLLFNAYNNEATLSIGNLYSGYKADGIIELVKGSYETTLKSATLSAARTILLPDASGTIALTSDISTTTVTPVLSSGTLIATINGTNIYAPAYTDADGVSY